MGPVQYCISESSIIITPSWTILFDPGGAPDRQYLIICLPWLRVYVYNSSRKLENMQRHELRIFTCLQTWFSWSRESRWSWRHRQVWTKPPESEVEKSAQNCWNEKVSSFFAPRDVARHGRRSPGNPCRCCMGCGQAWTVLWQHQWYRHHICIITWMHYSDYTVVH